MSHDPKYLVTRADGSPLPEGEPYFVLRGQDIFAYQSLSHYYSTLWENGYDFKSDFMRNLEQHVNEMRLWEPKKRPD